LFHAWFFGILQFLHELNLIQIVWLRATPDLLLVEQCFGMSVVAILVGVVKGWVIIWPGFLRGNNTLKFGN
ncbi:hypothetical protein PSY31_23285, partial [Shigella flexneri]|nr:hypothetical protein [Shigella flexneri]